MRKNEEFAISFESAEYSVKKKKKSWEFIYDWMDSLIYAIILIVVMLFNSAPSFIQFREKMTAMVKNKLPKKGGVN